MYVARICSQGLRVANESSYFYVPYATVQQLGSRRSATLTQGTATSDNDIVSLRMACIVTRMNKAEREAVFSDPLWVLEDGCPG